MDPAATGRSYDKIAKTWQDLPIADYGVAQVERAIRFTKKRGAALDIGCGSQGRMIDLLLRHGFSPEGIDVSAEMIALAQQRHPGIPFHVADVSEWRFLTVYDFILAWDSIWHLPLERQATVIEKICSSLAPGGVLIFTTGGLDAPGEKKGETCMDVPVDYSTLGIPRLLALLSEYGCICRHLEYDQYPEQHLYVIAQKSQG